MNRSDWESCCAWRALESADVEGRFLTAEQGAEATTRCRDDLTSDDVNPERLDERVRRFLSARARWLEDRSRVANQPSPRDLPLALRPATVPGALAAAGWIGAFVLGFGLTHLGNERELNLLALPLVGLLLWNALVMAASLIWECLPAGEGSGQGGASIRLLARLSRRAEPKADDALTTKARAAFAALAGDWGLRLLQRRARAWLHVAAAVVALGSMAALFANGWSREYRVVWESTLLNDSGAARFFQTLFAPASVLTGTPVPLDKVPEMRRGAGLATRPADALPWLKLYAGTLLIGVALPRLALAGLALLRARQDLRRAVAAQGWPGYALKLLRRVEGGDRPVLLLAPGAVLDERVRQRWQDWLGQLYGGRTAFDLQVVAEGEQDDWIAAWEPRDGRVVVVFFLASTPEEEVQRDFLRHLRARLEAGHYEPELVVLLDACGLRGRWSADKRDTRERLWLETLRGHADRLLVADEERCAEINGTAIVLRSNPA